MFNENCKILIDTDTGFKEGAPHLLATCINNYNGTPSSVDFDYQDVYDREDTYQDVVGFYHTHPAGLNAMSQTDVDTMEQWVKCLGKSLVCLIETDEQLNGWIFSKDQFGKINHNELIAISNNDVNYDIWLKKKSRFWSPADFLFEPDISLDEEKLEEISTNVNLLYENQKALAESIEAVQNSILDLVRILRDEL